MILVIFDKVLNKVFILKDWCEVGVTVPKKKLTKMSKNWPVLGWVSRSGFDH